MSVNVSAVMVGETREGLLGRMLGRPSAQVTITAPPLPAGAHDDDLQAVHLCAVRALRETAGRPTKPPHPARARRHGDRDRDREATGGHRPSGVRTGRRIRLAGGDAVSAVMPPPAHEPGSIRTVHYQRGRGPDGKYPVTYWGTVEEQVQEATAAIARDLSGSRHQPMDLFSFTDDCDHINPEDDERFDGVEGLVAAWLERNCLMGSDYPLFDRSVPFEKRQVRHDLRYKNARRAYAVIPLANEWERAQSEYDDTHAGRVCLASPMGSVCRGCLEDEGGDPDDSDFGIEPRGCLRQERSRERQSEFWWLFSFEQTA